MNIVIRISGPRLDGVFRACCPALPGCVVFGGSVREVRVRIRQAMQGYMEHMSVALPRELVRLANWARDGLAGRAGDLASRSTGIRCDCT